MIDQRLVKMAEVLVNYSLELKPGDKFLIESTDLATPLIKEVYRLFYVGLIPRYNCIRKA